MNRFEASLLWDAAEDLDHPDSSANDAQENDPPGFGGATPSYAEVARGQAFFVPMHYEPNYEYPLIVWLHSDGFNENQICHVMPHVSHRNYIATGVRGTQATDSAGHRFQWHDSAFALAAAEHNVLEAIDRAVTDYSVHPDRIVLAGYQSGGTMALRIALKHPDLFAAAITLGGSMGSLSELGVDAGELRQRRMPMLWQWSLESDRYDQDSLAKEIRTAMLIKARVEVRQYRNDDEMNTAVLSDLNQWIMNHVVCGAPVGKMSEWDSSPTSFSDN